MTDGSRIYPEPALADGGSDLGMGLLIGATGLQTLAGAFSAYQQGKLARSTAKFNAAMARLRARDAAFRGQQLLIRQGVAVRGLIGQQRAAFAAQGVEVDSGSALDVQADTQYQSTLDRVTIENNAAREAFGFETEARVLRAEGRAADRAGRVDAAGTIVAGGTNAAALYYRGR